MDWLLVFSLIFFQFLARNFSLPTTGEKSGTGSANEEEISELEGWFYCREKFNLQKI